MKIKEYFVPGVNVVCLNQYVSAPNLIDFCKYGIVVEVIQIDLKFYCSVSAYCDSSKGPRLHLALFPVKSYFTPCQVVNIAVLMLDYMGYIKHVKK